MADFRGEFQTNESVSTALSSVCEFEHHLKFVLCKIRLQKPPNLLEVEGYLKVALVEMAGPFWAFCKGYIVWQNGQKLPILGPKLHVQKRQENHAGS